MDTSRDPRSLGELFGDLTRQLSDLVRQEIDLARTEVSVSARTAGRGAAMVGAGGALLYAALLALLMTVGLALVQLGLDPWLAALIVGVVVGVIGAALVVRGRQELEAQNLMPDRTVQTLKDDVDWAKEQVR